MAISPIAKETSKEEKTLFSSSLVFPTVDSYYFYCEADHRPFKSKLPDQILDLYNLYRKLETGPMPISQQAYPLFPPTLNSIPVQYQVLQVGRWLYLDDRVPARFHHILYEMKINKNPNTPAGWGIFVRELEKKLRKAGMTKHEREFFKSRYEFYIEGTQFLLKKTKAIKSPKKNDAFLASIGGMTEYAANFKERTWNKLRWAQILLHYFKQDIKTYGLHFALDLPVSIEEVAMTAISTKIQKTKKEFGSTVYYRFTKAGEKIYIYCKTTKDGGYLPMTRIELALPASVIKRLNLYDLHQECNGNLSQEKIKKLAEYIVKRLQKFNITHKGLPVRLPSQKKIEDIILKFLKGINGHPYNPCPYSMTQQNFAESCRVLNGVLEACKSINKQKGRNIELEISLLGNSALYKQKKKFIELAKISKEVFNEKVIPHLVRNYHRVAPSRDRKLIEKIRKVNSIKASKSGVYKLSTDFSIFIDTSIENLLLEDPLLSPM